MIALSGLRRAEQHIFSTGLPDSGTRLALANMRYGLAKVHHLQELLGHRPDATFVAAPDCTVTRNAARWRSGFGYGGVVTWGDGDAELIVLDIKPNACGMVAGGLDRLPDRLALLERIDELGRSEVEIDGVGVEWDFGKSNHFVDVFRVVPESDDTLPPYAFLMHFSGDELRGDSDFGPGIYWDRSEVLRQRMEVIETEWGPLRVLLGAHARAYYEHYSRVEAFVRKRRSYAAERIFGPYELLSHETHQGLVGMNRMVLGCYRFDDPARLYPVALRADEVAYLVRGRPNLSDATMKRLGFCDRARRLDVEAQVRGAHLLPHGGGYVFPDIEDVADVHELKGDRYFELVPRSGRGRQIVKDVFDMPYEYRDRRVLERAVDLDLLEVVARLVPEFVLKV